VTRNYKAVYKFLVYSGHFFFLFYTGTKQQVRLLRGIDPEVSSHQLEGMRRFGTNLLWTVYFLLQKSDCSYVFYLYCPGQIIVHSRWELESETLVFVTCGQLLAV
jgi:hypothetical protein